MNTDIVLRLAEHRINICIDVYWIIINLRNADTIFKSPSQDWQQLWKRTNMESGQELFNSSICIYRFLVSVVESYWVEGKDGVFVYET